MRTSAKLLIVLLALGLLYLASVMLYRYAFVPAMNDLPTAKQYTQAELFKTAGVTPGKNVAVELGGTTTIDYDPGFFSTIREVPAIKIGLTPKKGQHRIVVVPLDQVTFVERKNANPAKAVFNLELDGPNVEAEPTVQFDRSYWLFGKVEVMQEPNIRRTSQYEYLDRNLSDSLNNRLKHVTITLTPEAYDRALRN